MIIRQLCHSKDHDCATVVEHPDGEKVNQFINHTQSLMIMDMWSGMMLDLNMVSKKK